MNTSTSNLSSAHYSDVFGPPDKRMVVQQMGYACTTVCGDNSSRPGAICGNPVYLKVCRGTKSPNKRGQLFEACGESKDFWDDTHFVKFRPDLPRYNFETQYKVNVSTSEYLLDIPKTPSRSPYAASNRHGGSQPFSEEFYAHMRDELGQEAPAPGMSPTKPYHAIYQTPRRPSPLKQHTTLISAPTPSPTLSFSPPSSPSRSNISTPLPSQKQAQGSQISARTPESDASHTSPSIPSSSSTSTSHRLLYPFSHTRNAFKYGKVIIVCNGPGCRLEGLKALDSTSSSNGSAKAKGPSKICRNCVHQFCKSCCLIFQNQGAVPCKVKEHNLVLHLKTTSTATTQSTSVAALGIPATNGLSNQRATADVTAPMLHSDAPTTATTVTQAMPSQTPSTTESQPHESSVSDNKLSRPLRPEHYEARTAARRTWQDQSHTMLEHRNATDYLKKMVTIMFWKVRDIPFKCCLMSNVNFFTRIKTKNQLFLLFRVPYTQSSLLANSNVSISSGSGSDNSDSDLPRVVDFAKRKKASRNGPPSKRHKKEPVTVDVGSDSEDEETLKRLPSSNHGPWPVKYVKGMDEGFSEMDSRTDGTTASRFEDAFGVEFPKTTYYKIRALWQDASDELKQRYITAGYTPKGLWSNFKKEAGREKGQRKSKEGATKKKKVKGPDITHIKQENCDDVLDLTHLTDSD
ncbi:hypothetical protein CVT24_007238 [Panaeolus cyanescens]|uniref:Uncharacterized protein n=1 Tax=Panaeolus cyanescens TaxID=181874 RepID=A0A409YPC8_9AGAR|nr:hypothetical protein CVT24_007238 [Panaeolus cyanescens]